MNKHELIKKISVKTVCGKIEPPTDNKVLWLMEAFGIARGIDNGQRITAEICHKYSGAIERDCDAERLCIRASRNSSQNSSRCPS